MGFTIRAFRNLSAANALALAMCATGLCQTYKVNPGSPEQSQSQEQVPGEKQSSPQASQPSAEKSLGWGSNIQTARLARAAETALKSGNYSAAVDYARRAAQGSPADAQLWFLLGYAARLDGKTQDSVDAFERGLRVNPASLEGQSGLAQTYVRMGRSDDARKLLEKVVAADPRRAGDWQLLGEMLLRSGEYGEALTRLQRAEQSRPDARSELLLALTYEKLQQFKDAEHYIDLAKHRSPNNLEVLRSLAGYYRETGNYSAAIAALKSIASKNPDIKAELAYTYQLSGKQDEAAKLYVQAADAAPRDVNLQLSAAQAELSTEEIESANRFLNRAQKLDPNHYRLHAIRGEIAKLEERDEDAVQEYTAALKNMPQSAAEGPLYPIQMRLNLVPIFERLQNESAAKSELAQAQSEIGQLDIQGQRREEYLRLRALVKFYAGDTASALRDVHDALALNPKDTTAMQMNGDLLVKMGQKEEATVIYKKILDQDADNELALTSLGSVSRELGRDREAEKYLLRLAAARPHYYPPHLALGDMYTARRDFEKAQAEYRKANNLVPNNSLTIAGGMNAAIEAHQFSLAAEWLSRASAQMQQNPFVLREKERYLNWVGKYQESADVGNEAIKKLPDDRDVVVYLGYDLLHLERYDELLKLTLRYEQILPKEPDLPLLAGYVYKHNRDREEALAAFTRAIDRGPDVATAYVNRGFILHDLRKSGPAAADFETALRIEPKNGEANLGLAYADLDLHRPRQALEHAKLAEKKLGESNALHLIRGTAYGDEGMLKRAVAEYRIAVKNDPQDAELHIALAKTLYDLNQYQEGINELKAADKIAPGDGLVYAELARFYAQLRDRDRTMQYVELAEKHGESTVYLRTGEALSILGDQNAAMERFERALMAGDSDRVGVRLAIARLMLKRGENEDTRRQITLALMESASGRTAPPSPDELVQAADLLLGLHEYQMAQTYFQRALAAGANEMDVRVGLANAYLAMGDTPRADAQLDEVSKNQSKDDLSYQYLLARADAYRQRHQNGEALTAFAQAAEAAGQDQAASTEMLRTSGDEGLRLNHTVSFLSDYSLSPIFEDTTVYPLDAKLAAASAGTLPPPRSSIQSQWTEAFHLHLAGLPDSGGFFQIRNARGDISLPSANTIVSRDTWDYSFNYSVAPSLRLGDNVLNFNAGIQQTIRRDNLDPYDMNQNLFRQFVYMSTSSFFNWVSLTGSAIRETGPFTEQHGEHSRDLSGSLEFRVGRPWAKTAFVTGWGARDEQFSPINREFYYTSTYGGIEQKFGDRLQLRVIGEYLRSWRVEISDYAISQAFRPAGTVVFSPTRNWSVQTSFAYSRNMGFHAYDAVQSGFAISYAMPIQKAFHDKGHELAVRYPIRFSAGMQEEDFFNFGGSGNNQQFRPYFQITIF